MSFIESMQSNMRNVYYVFMESHHGDISHEISSFEKHALSRLGFLLHTIVSPIFMGIDLTITLLSPLTFLSKKVRDEGLMKSFFVRESLGVYLDFVLTITSIVSIITPSLGEMLKDLMIEGVKSPCKEPGKITQILLQLQKDAQSKSLT